MARKILNIFLRGALYNVYLREHYHLDRAEAFYEVALDRLVAAKIKEHSPPRSLPVWPGVKWLDREMSEVFQQRAAEIAEDRGFHRVHLDMLFWADRA